MYIFCRYGLKLNNNCCFDYEVPTSVLKEVGTIATYNKTADDWYSIFKEI